jgi:hypothetical protein
MLEDYFENKFDMLKLPTGFASEDGRGERTNLSKFFNTFTRYYIEAVQASNYNPLLFILTKPYHMLYGRYNDTYYFVLSSKFALKGRTAIYRMKDGLFLDVEKLSIYSAACGFEENSTVVHIPSYLCEGNDNDEIDDKIKKEAYELVEFECRKLEMERKLMRVTPFFGDIEFVVNPRKVFMLMPFGDPLLNEFYTDHIKKAIEQMDMNCMRADDIFNNKSIINDIWRNINEARIIVADLTHRNPNVFYEVGIAHTLGKEVILISQEENDIPFDLRHIRTIFYKNTYRGVQQFEVTLKETIRGIIEVGTIQG